MHSSCMLPLLFASLCTRAGAVLARYWLLPRSAVHTFSFASLCYPRQRFVPGRGPDTVTDTLLIIITGATHSLVPMPGCRAMILQDPCLLLVRQLGSAGTCLTHLRIFTFVCVQAVTLQSCIVGLQVERDVSKRTTSPEEMRKGR